MPLNKKLAKEWHFTLNKSVLPDSVSMSSNKKFWWLGECGHEWEASPSNRGSLNSGCPYCAGKKVLTGFNDLATTEPELTLEWMIPKNQSLTPESVSRGCVIKAWWKGKCGHEWYASINSRSRGSGCPFCAGRKVLKCFNDLATTDPEISNEWHSTLNNGILPTEVSRGSHKKAWWVCSYGHEWSDTIKKRAIERRSCHYCNNRKLIVGFNDLFTTNPVLSSQWHTSLNGYKTPRDVKAGSGIKAWWVCSLGHAYKAIINDRNNGSGCPICDHKQLLSGFNDLATIHPEIAKTWHQTKNDKNPNEIMLFTAGYYWWQCDKGHEWKAAPSSRRGGSACPSCASYGFSPSKPACFYFIKNKELNAIKIGITNVGTDRIKRWNKKGWDTLLILESSDGHAIKSFESEIKIWLKKDKKQQNFLNAQNIGNMGGWTETFINDEKLIVEIINFINSRMGTLV